MYVQLHGDAWIKESDQIRLQLRLQDTVRSRSLLRCRSP
uniref:Uncharacterized protein n=1 Tax=Aegilops tauschii subsp. strangulata TaxID=200361 RepID=A0A453A911_AEGTS